MKENLKRYIGLLLAVIMVVSMVPASAVPALADTFTSNVIGPLQLEEEEVDFGEPDPSAGLESEGEFIASLHEVRLKGLPYNQRLLAVAETQLGYTESDLNFVVKEDEATGKKAKYGITRYGQWYGLPYEDWCAMFISFCLHYAGVPNYLMPADSGAFTWVNRLQSMGLFRWRNEYTPKPGDLIFFDFDLSGQSDHVGIVSSLYTVDGVAMVETIEGNHSKTVEKFSYPLISLEIQGYGVMSEEIPAEEQESSITTDYVSGEDTYRVTMTYTADALIPDNAVLIVNEILPGTPEYDAYVAESAGALGWEEGSVSDAKVLDISIYADGAEVQPAAPVNVEMVLVDKTAEDWNVVHFGKEETQVLESTAEGDTVSFASDGFSIFVFAKSKLEKSLVASDGNTYNITLTYDDKAGIPDNAELVVTEIIQEVSEDPDASSEYDKYLSKAEGALEKNQRVTFARFFDITIVADGQEIQPASPVEVKIELANEELTAEETEDVKAVHFSSEGDVTALDTTRDSQTVTFNAEGFSVYGIVGTETISEQYIDAHGDTYKVTVTYSEDAQIPEGAKLSVTEISEDSNEYQEFYSKAAEAVLDGQEKAVPFARFFDISIMDGEEEIQPQAPVDVKIEFIGNVETQSGARFNAVHFTESSIDVMDASVQLAAEENHAVEAVSFEAEGFSVYGVTYTVDFTYKNYTFSIPGESSILLSELFEILGIEADVAEVTSVEFTDYDLIRIEQLENDWLLSSLMPFDTDELLTVTTRSGIVYRIEVQDEQDVTFPASIKASGGTYYKQGDVQTVTAQYVLTGQGQTQILNTLGLYNTPINTDEIYCTLYYQAYKHSSYNEVIYLLEIRPLDEVLIGTGYSIDNSSLWDIYTPSGNNDIDSSTARYPQTGNPASAQNTKTIAYLKNNSYTHRRALALVFSRPVSGRYNYQLMGSGSSGLVVYKVIEVTYTDGDANGQAFTPDQVYSQRSQINGSTGAWSSVNMPAFVAADGTNTPSWTDHTFTGWKVTASEDENIPVGTVYSAADLPATVHNNVTFEAQWSSHSDKKVTVSKIVEPGTGVTADEIDQTIYIALYDQSSDTYLADGDGHIIYKEIAITDGTPEPVSVEFDGLSATRYSVREFVEVDGEKVTALHSTFVADGNLIELSGITGYNTDEGGNRITDSDNDADMANADNAWVVFENTYTTEDEPRTLTVNKKWMKNGVDITDTITDVTATFTLYRSIPDGEDEEVKSITLDGVVDEQAEGVTDGEFAKWSATFSNYPARDDSGNKYTYKVRETACTPKDYLPYANPDSTLPMTETDYKVDNQTIYNKYQKVSVTVKKENDKGTFIPGAKFELLKVVTEESGDTHDEAVSEFTVDEEGGYKIADLDSGDYKLKEKSAPGGYVIINADILFHVDVLASSGVITWPDNTKPDTVKNLTTTDVTNDTFTVINIPGTELPSTGGPGTLLYTLSGLALMFGSALMYGFRMRRRERRFN